MARFARRGIRSTLSYSPSSVCLPSRYAIFTECQVGVRPIRGNWNADEIELVENFTFVQDLHDIGGYKTAYFGKWGLGQTIGGPWNYGFDHFLGQLQHTEAHTLFPDHYWKYDVATNIIPKTFEELESLRVTIPENDDSHWNEENCPLDPSSPCVCINDVVTKASMDFIKSNKESKKSFFLFWAPTYPHSGKYNTNDADKTRISPVKRLSEDRINKRLNSQTRGHAAQIEQHLDGDMKLLLDYLEAHPEYDKNTFIVFTSDNGAQSETSAYSPKTFQSTGGLAGSKRSMYEGGIRVPTLVRWIGVIPENILSRIPNALYDLGSTFREAAQIPARKKFGTNGEDGNARSMLQAWKTGNDNLSRDWLHFEVCDGAWGQDKSCSTATIDIRGYKDPNLPIWKLYVPKYARYRDAQLYDLRTDPTESKPKRKADDVRSKMWEKRESLRALF